MRSVDKRGSSVRTRRGAPPGASLGRHPRPKESVFLLAAAPIIAVREELEKHVSDLRRLAPLSDATTALTLYLEKLAKAVEDARDLELFMSVEAAAVILGKSPNMVTYLCRTGALDAKKIGGTWHIVRKSLEVQRGG
jgi:hypothetical protein